MSFISKATRIVANYTSKAEFPLTLGLKKHLTSIPFSSLVPIVPKEEDQKKSYHFNPLKGIAAAGLCGFAGAALLGSSKKTEENLQEVQISNLLEQAKTAGVHFGIELRKQPRNIRERYRALEKTLATVEAALLAVQYRNLLRQNQPVPKTYFNPLAEIAVIEAILTSLEQYVKTHGDSQMAICIKQFREEAILKRLLFPKKESENHLKSGAFIAAIALGVLFIPSRKT